MDRPGLVSAERFKRTLALFGLVCLVGAVLTPWLAWQVHARDSAAPRPGSTLHAAGSVIGDPALLSGAELWAEPATIDRSAITCQSNLRKRGTLTAHDLGADRARHRTVTVDGTEVRYLTSADGLTQIRCEGPGLTGIRLSEGTAATGGNGAAVAVLLAAPILAIVGLAIRRTGYRVSGRHVS